MSTQRGPRLPIDILRTRQWRCRAESRGAGRRAERVGTLLPHSILSIDLVERIGRRWAHCLLLRRKREIGRALRPRRGTPQGPGAVCRAPRAINRTNAPSVSLRRPRIPSLLLLPLALMMHEPCDDGMKLSIQHASRADCSRCRPRHRRQSRLARMPRPAAGSDCPLACVSLEYVRCV